MRKITLIKWTLSSFALVALTGLVACSGGGGGPTTPVTPPAKTIADRLDYTNPTGSGYTLVKNGSSTSTHLVLDLMGPVGTQGTGVGFYLSTDPAKVTWSKPASSDTVLARNVLFDLGTAPQLMVGKANTGGDQLQVAFYQKGITKPAVNFTASSILATVAVDLKSNVPLGAVSLSAPSGKAVITNGASTPTTITINVGTISAN